MMNTRFFAALVAVTLVAAACGASEEAGAPTSSAPGSTTVPTTPSAAGYTPGEVIAVDLPRQDAQVTPADIAAVVAADSQFGLDLFEVVASDENLMVSPYSIATALSMLYPGARGITAQEIAGVLHLSVDDATLHAVRNHIDRLLSQAPPPMGDDDTREPFTIRPANSAWGQGGYPFLDEYLAVLAENYGAGLRVVDYVGDAEGSRALINQWVEDATEDRIRDLIPQGAITVDTRLALVNAIWFKANWFEQFDPAATSPGPFTLVDGSTIEVPLMYGSQRTGYADTERFEALRLPYAGDAAMVILLPKQGTPADLVSTLTVDDLDLTWTDAQVEITLPRFEFEGEIGLKAALQQLGMITAFEFPSAGGADLTGITAVRELYVSDAFHKTFIKLDEQGTEAAAATALIVGLESMPQAATFTADRPFLFWIEHTATGEMLFLGQVTDPS